MYRPTDRQRALFPAAGSLSSSQQRRLRKSWATHFAEHVLPLLLTAEAEFADLYHRDNGRPNWGLARMLGILLLQELNDLPDQVALDALSFDIRWQHALDLSPGDAYLSRRSYLDFRARLLRADPELLRVRGLFDQVLLAALEDLGTSTTDQRIDSTHIVSNVRIRGRLDLFAKTLRHFLTGLRAEHSEAYAALHPELRTWAERDRDGWFARSDANARAIALDTLVGWCVELVLKFGSDPSVALDERFLLLKRLVDEQCEVVENAPDDVHSKLADGSPAPEQLVAAAPDDNDNDNDNDDNDDNDNDNDNDNGVKARSANQKKRRRKASKKSKRSKKARTITSVEGRTITLRAPGDIGGSSLQSPFDPGAGYGHKGSGYSVQIAETCNNENTELITDYAVHPASTSDHGQAALSVERTQSSDIAPEQLYADSGYISGGALLEATANGYELIGPAVGSRLPDGHIGRDAFEIDPFALTVVGCPEGHAPIRYALRSTKGGTPRTPHAYFDGATCRDCPLLGKCAVRGPTNGKRGSFHLEVLPELIERDRALTRQKSTEWWKIYAIRGGIEATNSELKRAQGLGRLRVRGAVRVKLAVAMKLIACNIKRWGRAAAAAASEAASGSSRAPWRTILAHTANLTAANGIPWQQRLAGA